MFKMIRAFTLLLWLGGMFAPAPLVLPVMSVTAVVATVEMAAACEVGVNCNDPTAVGKGKKAPLWKVMQCVIGQAGGPYTPIACNDPQAVHKSPKGLDSVCFLGSDGKYHYDFPGIVYEGRTFKNLRVGKGANQDWQPLWTLTAAEKRWLGIK